MAAPTASAARLAAWGRNDFGQLPGPPALEAGERLTALAAGLRHTVALTSRGRLLAWGHDGYGQCSGQPALGEGERLTAVSAGRFHTAALTSRGRVLAWGYDGYGQCSGQPALREGEHFAVVSAGALHTVALTSSGRVLAWGWDGQGLCSGCPALEAGERFVAASAGGGHSVALTCSGRVVAWGRDDEGQCSGQPALQDGDRISAVSAGWNHTAALTSSGQILVWGSDDHGECSRRPALEEGEHFTAVSAGESHTLSLTSTGRVVAWGRNNEGQCSQCPALQDGERYEAVAAGCFHSVALVGSIQDPQAPTPALPEAQAAGHSGDAPSSAASEDSLAFVVVEPPADDQPPAEDQLPEEEQPPQQAASLGEVMRTGDDEVTAYGALPADDSAAADSSGEDEDPDAPEPVPAADTSGAMGNRSSGCGEVKFILKVHWAGERYRLHLRTEEPLSLDDVLAALRRLPRLSGNSSAPLVGGSGGRGAGATGAAGDEGPEPLLPGALQARYLDEEGDLCALCPATFDDFLEGALDGRRDRRGRPVLRLALGGGGGGSRGSGGVAGAGSWGDAVGRSAAAGTAGEESSSEESDAETPDGDLAAAAAGRAAGSPTPGRCFTKDTLLQTAAGEYRLVHQLKRGDRVRAADGRETEVAFAAVHPKSPETLTTLQSPQAKLTVTGCHRVVVPAEDGSAGLREVRAETLRPGDRVVCGARAQRLVKVEAFRRRVELVEVRFDPDLPVEACAAPSHGILSKGEAMPLRTLGGLGPVMLDVPGAVPFARRRARSAEP